MRPTSLLLLVCMPCENVENTDDMPAVNLIYALHRSLTTIVAGSISVADRVKMHHEAAKRVRAAADELGLKRVALDDKCCANGMTAVGIEIYLLL